MVHFKWKEIAPTDLGYVLGCLVVCVEVLQPSQPNGVIQARSVYLTLQLGRLNSLSSTTVLCPFFPQKLTTALLESAEGRE